MPVPGRADSFRRLRQAEEVVNSHLLTEAACDISEAIVKVTNPTASNKYAISIGLYA